MGMGLLQSLQRSVSRGVFLRISSNGRLQRLTRGIHLLLHRQNLCQRAVPRSFGGSLCGQRGVKLLLQRVRVGIDDERGDLGIKARSQSFKVGFLSL